MVRHPLVAVFAHRGSRTDAPIGLVALGAERTIEQDPAFAIRIDTTSATE